MVVCYHYVIKPTRSSSFIVQRFTLCQTAPFSYSKIAVKHTESGLLVKREGLYQYKWFK